MVVEDEEHRTGRVKKGKKWVSGQNGLDWSWWVGREGGMDGYGMSR